jgi:hypothetical protein
VFLSRIIPSSFACARSGWPFSLTPPSPAGRGSQRVRSRMCPDRGWHFPHGARPSHAGRSGTLPMNRSASSPRPTPPFGTEERTARALCARCAGNRPRHVAQISNLLYRGFPTRWMSAVQEACGVADHRPAGSRRYSKLEICATQPRDWERRCSRGTRRSADFVETISPSRRSRTGCPGRAGRVCHRR